MAKNIVVIATLDTKAEEAFYLCEKIRHRGHMPLILDIGISGKAPLHDGITRQDVAISAGSSLEEIIARSGGYTHALSWMAKGAANILKRLVEEKRLGGVVSIGGSLGTSQALKVMKELPFQIPKLAVSSVAFIGELITIEMVSADQVMMQTVADLQGLNGVTKTILDRAAGAICGMVDAQPQWGPTQGGRVGISVLGVHDYADQCKRILSENGYEAVIFHSVGTGALEKLVRQHFFEGILDLCCYELVNYVCGGPVRGGRDKFTAGIEAGIPQVISLGAIDFFPWPVAWPFLRKFKDRPTVSHADANLVKTTPYEQKKIARLLAERLNKAKVATVVLVPLRGFSRLDRSPEMPFYDGAAGKRVYELLRRNIENALVELYPLDCHINDEVFAKEATERLLQKLVNYKSKAGGGT